MIDYENMRTTVAKGLKNYLGCPVVRSNQNAEMPPYPYVSYTITTLMSENRGTYGEYEDGKARKWVNCIWSISAFSDDSSKSVILANKAREWLDYVGTVYLSDNDIVVQSVGSVTNRDNVLTTEYEYRNGFDVVFSLFDTVESEVENAGVIDHVILQEGEEVQKPNPDEIIANLTKQVEIMKTAFNNVKFAIEQKGIDIPEDMPVSEYYTAIQQITGGITDSEIDPNSTNPVMNKAIWAALEKELDVKDLENAIISNAEIEDLLR